MGFLKKGPRRSVPVTRREPSIRERSGVRDFERNPLRSESGICTRCEFNDASVMGNENNYEAIGKIASLRVRSFVARVRTMVMNDVALFMLHCIFSFYTYLY